MAMGMRAMSLEAAVVAFDDAPTEVESEDLEKPADKIWCEKWWKRLLGPIMEEERQLRVIKAKVTEQVEPETVAESSADGSQVVAEDKVQVEEDDIDKGVQEELEIRRQLEVEQTQREWDQTRMAMQIAEYDRDRELQEKEDEVRYEALQASYAQE